MGLLKHLMQSLNYPTLNFCNIATLLKNFLLSLKLFQVYGSNQATDKILPFLIKNCKKNIKFLTTSGKQYCDFCHIDDVVNAIFKSLFTKKTSGEFLILDQAKSSNRVFY